MWCTEAILEKHVTHVERFHCILLPMYISIFHPKIVLSIYKPSAVFAVNVANTEILLISSWSTSFAHTITSSLSGVVYESNSQIIETAVCWCIGMQVECYNA